MVVRVGGGGGGQGGRDGRQLTFVVSASLASVICPWREGRLATAAPASASAACPCCAVCTPSPGVRYIIDPPLGHLHRQHIVRYIVDLPLGHLHRQHIQRAKRRETCTAAAPLALFPALFLALFLALNQSGLPVAASRAGLLLRRRSGGGGGAGIAGTNRVLRLLHLPHLPRNLLLFLLLLLWLRQKLPAAAAAHAACAEVAPPTRLRPFERERQLPILVVLFLVILFVVSRCTRRPDGHDTPPTTPPTTTSSSSPASSCCCPSCRGKQGKNIRCPSRGRGANAADRRGHRVSPPLRSRPQQQALDQLALLLQILSRRPLEPRCVLQLQTPPLLRLHRLARLRLSRHPRLHRLLPPLPLLLHRLYRRIQLPPRRARLLLALLLLRLHGCERALPLQPQLCRHIRHPLLRLRRPLVRLPRAHPQLVACTLELLNLRPKLRASPTLLFPPFAFNLTRLHRPLPLRLHAPKPLV